ncbi:molybdenum ABC transporter ATP-binding protein [candidate division KSB1 bacterium]|nr:molybdenum ABC transporter ATP-binding protein [candidate division KSB1 bacterium]NIR72384.1 molybdenum ABC transporter ATP-binding protein [candidate division KSB1 bacterium]NIS23570.1 molybdenum ABC transporter ATP-binding protein [candidate division KSB1 bacterium]NIT70499.1 molybdenum ABC transporter ATP-binding protein [candidate division KSB1 bacterium]NIU24204.1 molybdenum ABC transporter ATP-binding protein [candidate division KSB1 bacterium]
MLKITAKKQIAEFRLDLDLQIESSFTALFGPSGSGKTTTLNLIAGLTQPSDGEIVLDERILFSKSQRINLPPQKRNVGYIFQESRLFPQLTVRKNLMFGLRYTAYTIRKFRFNEIAEVAGVLPLMDRRTGDLSGGEKQRVALARALLASPDYLLMDEPLAALDMTTRLAFLNFLKNVHRQFRLPILYVSHDLANVLNFADHVIVLQNGKSVGSGPTYSLLDKMKSAPLLSREDVANLFNIKVTSHEPSRGVTTATVGQVTFTLPHLESAVGEMLLLNIPASEIIISLQEPHDLSASNILAGTVKRIHHLGERVLVEVDTGVKFIVEIVPATVERLALQPGKRVFLIIKASSFRKLG